MGKEKFSRIEIIASEGEGQRIEFKRSLSNIDKEIVAFSNASGGRLFLGIEDNGEIVGIKITNKLLSEINDIAYNCDPSIQINIIRHIENVIEIEVKEGINKPYRCKTGFYLRIGPSSQKLKRDDIIKLFINSGRVHFDEIENDDFDFKKDFDNIKLKKFKELSEITINAPAEILLNNLDLIKKDAKRVICNNSCILFFAKKPQRFIKESFISCVRYKGSDRFSIIDRQEIDGDLINQIDTTLKFIKRNIAVSYEISGEGQHQEIFEYPLPAIREAVLNAVMHRDYHFDTSHIYIHIFEDRIEFENPGGLPPGISIEELGERSVRRNRSIADLLYRAKYIERIGSGFIRMKKALKNNNNPEMQISSTNYFVLRFLPRMQENNDLSSRQYQLLQFIKVKKQVSKGVAAKYLEVSPDTALRELKILLAKKLVTIDGVGRGTIYKSNN